MKNKELFYSLMLWVLTVAEFSTEEVAQAIDKMVEDFAKAMSPSWTPTRYKLLALRGERHSPERNMVLDELYSCAGKDICGKRSRCDCHNRTLVLLWENVMTHCHRE